jgi:hypothetical protein
MPAGRFTTDMSAIRERASRTVRHPGGDLLGVYLNDHLAGATVGAELARRMAASAAPGSAAAGALPELAGDIAADRAALIEIMAALGIPRRGYKVLAAWAGEKVGRLKLNGRLLARSPLSGLVETELLALGVAGKAAGWRTLRALADRDSRLDAGRLDELIARAGRQSAALEALRGDAAGQLLAAVPADRKGSEEGESGKDAS